MVRALALFVAAALLTGCPKHCTKSVPATCTAHECTLEITTYMDLGFGNEMPITNCYSYETRTYPCERCVERAP